MDLITQGLSIAGLIGIVASYQQKKKSALIFCQLIGAGLFSIHYLLLGAYAGFLLNIIAVTRSIVFCNKNLPKHIGRRWVWTFHALCLCAYVLTFALFGTPFTITNLLLEILPVIGMFSLSISFNMGGTKAIRRLGTISSVCWLIYNIAHVSIGGIACEAVCLVSIVVGMLRFDRRKNP